MASNSLSLAEKESALSSILKRVKNVELTDLMRKISSLNFKNEKEIEKLVTECLTTAIDHRKSSAKYAEVLKSFRDSSTIEIKKNFNKSLNKLLKIILEPIDHVSCNYVDDTTLRAVHGTVLIYGNLYNTGLVDGMSIVNFVMKYDTGKYERSARKWLLDTIKHTVAAQLVEAENTGNSAVMRLYSILDEEGLIGAKVDESSKKSEKASQPRSIDKATEIIENFLNKINNNNVNELTQKFKDLNLAEDTEELKMFAEKLVALATLENTKFVANYALLAKKYSATMSAKCQTILMNQVHEYTMDVVICLITMQVPFLGTEAREKFAVKGTAIFMGHLYNVDYFEPERIVQYLMKLETLADDRDCRKTILQTIKDRIVEQLSCSCNLAISVIYNMLNNEGMICDESSNNQTKATAIIASALFDQNPNEKNLAKKR